MKLSELRVAIRAYKGNPSVVAELIAGAPMTLVLQKTVFLEELARVYGNERTAETGLVFDEATGLVAAVQNEWDAPEPDLDDVAGSQDDEDML